MLELDSKSLTLIKKACKGKKHIKLTIGFIANDEKVIKVFNETEEIENKNYIYEIGSITKTFNASLLAKYIYEGKMSLDDSIQKYIDGLNISQHYPTLRRLATHTSGYSQRLPLNRYEFFKMLWNIILGFNQEDIPFDMDFEKMKECILENRLENKEYKWKYSNFGHALIGYALGVVSGKGYKDTMNEFLFKELGLTHTYSGTYSNKNLYGFNKRNKDCGNWDWGNNLMSPAGSLSSTADDLLNYAMVNMLETKPYLSICYQKYAKISKKYDMGLGWWLYKNDNNIICHGGDTGSFSSFLAVDRRNEIAVVVLGNYRFDGISCSKIGDSILENLLKKTKCE